MKREDVLQLTGNEVFSILADRIKEDGFIREDEVVMGVKWQDDEGSEQTTLPDIKILIGRKK